MNRIKYFVTFFLVLFLILGSQQAMAADDLDLLSDDLDLLGELEAAPAEEKEDRFKYLTQIGKNFEGSIRLRGHVFYRDPVDREGIDKRNPVGEALLRIRGPEATHCGSIFPAGSRRGHSRTHTKVSSGGPRTRIARGTIWN